MRFTLVGNRRGKRSVVWPSVFRIALFIVPIPAAAVPLISLAVRKLWDNMLIFYGAASGVVIVIILVIAAACTELRRLPVIHEDRPPSE